MRLRITIYVYSETPRLTECVMMMSPDIIKLVHIRTEPSKRIFGVITTMSSNIILCLIFSNTNINTSDH
jgi:hypothetical protein